MIAKVDISRTFVLPAFQAAGWDDDAQPNTQQCRDLTALDVLQAELNAQKRPHTQTAAELHALLPTLVDRAFQAE